MRLPAPRGAALFTRVLLALCAVVLPLYALGLLIYLSGTNALRNRLQQNELFEVQSAAHRIDQEYEHVQSMMEGYLDNYRVRYFAIGSVVMSDYERAQTILTIQEELALLSGASPVIADVSVTFPSLGWRVSPSRAGRSSEYGALSYSFSGAGGPSFDSSSMTVSIPYPPNYAATGIQFVLSVAFSPSAVSGILSASMHSTAGTIGIVRADGAPLATSVFGALDGKAAAGVIAASGGSDEAQALRIIAGRSYLVSAAAAGRLGGWIVATTSTADVFGPLAGYRSWLWALTALTVVLGGLFASWISGSVRRPLAKLMDGFRRVETGDLAAQLAPGPGDEFGYLFAHFNAMVRSLDATMRRCVEQESLARRAELAQLQYQINPHFLYNSIYHIYRMARAEDYESIQSYTLHLGSFYETITRSSVDEVTLKEEAKHALSYAEVQRIRFRDRISVDLGEVPSPIAGLVVPRLIVQPVLENAYNHGLRNVLEGGRLVVRYEVQGDAAVVVVEDNGPGMSPEELDQLRASLANGGDGEGARMSGLVNIHRRLVLRYRGRAGVRLEASRLGGLKVSLVVPVGGAA